MSFDISDIWTCGGEFSMFYRVAIYFVRVCEICGSSYSCVMSSKHVLASRVLKELTVSDRLLILLKLCMSVCARVCV